MTFRKTLSFYSLLSALGVLCLSGGDIVPACVCVYTDMEGISSTYRTCFAMKGSETLQCVHNGVAFKAEKLLTNSC